jgi:hypothetical protein
MECPLLARPEESMTRRALVRIAVAAGAALCATFAAAGPAVANVADVPINSGNVPTAAKAFHPETQNCSASLGGGAYAGKDVWVFNLPDKPRDFVSVTAKFDTDGDGDLDVTVLRRRRDTIFRARH